LEYRASLALIALVVGIVLAVSDAGADECIIGNAAWTGTVKVTGTLVVDKGATLVIEPGTTVLIEPAEKGEEGLARSGILVKGDIQAVGTPEKPITFTSSAYRPAPGDWGEVQVLESSGSRFQYCLFQYAGWGVHVHDSALTVDSCEFRENEFGGIRGRGDGFTVKGSDITGMDIGIRFWKGAPTITYNRITNNRTGLFFRQGCGDAAVKGNDLSGNIEYAVKLGDMHEEDVDVSGNYWGTADTDEIEGKIFDNRRENYIGSVVFEPVLESPPESGVSGGLGAGDKR